MTQHRPIRLVRSPGFRSWLAEHDVSLALSTYQAGKLLLIGRTLAGLSLETRPFRRCMGLWAEGRELWVASRYELVQLVARDQEAMDRINTGKGISEIDQILHDRNIDRFYEPRLRYTTGNLDTHDVIRSQDGIVFVNTRFSCLAKPHPHLQFEPIWKPPFVQEISPHDRCHLNGLAHRAGRPALVTACCPFDGPRAWRQHRGDGGCVIDVASGEFVVQGLSMPHSPRIRGDTVWLLESGSGYLGTLDLARGTFERRAFCPGYLRGLTFWGRFALIGSSLIRRPDALEGLTLGDNLRRHRASAVCGLFIVDCETGELIHWLRIEGHVKELYDVVVLPGVRRPAARGTAARTGPDAIQYYWKDQFHSWRAKAKS